MKYQKPRGTVDIYYQKAEQFFAIEIIIRQLASKYNFNEIKTPIFESKPLFVRSVGENSDIVEKELFELSDKKDRQFALRPEGTAGVVRSIIEDKIYGGEYELPLKLFYFGPMFRYERPQQGRLRQFNHFGVEIVGAKSYLLDVETILFAYNIIKTLGIKNIAVKLNMLVNDKQVYLKVLLNYLQTKSLCEDCQRRIVKNPLRILDCKLDASKFADCPKMYDFLDEADKKYFDSITKTLTKLDLPWSIDHNLVRGLDYYTSVVFEIVSLDEKQGSQSTLIGGGRYDKLFEELKGPNLPAIGFAAGIERLMIALENENIQLVNDTYIDAYVICLNEKARYFASSLLLMLRTAGYRIDCDYLDRSVKAQFKSSDRLNAKFTIIVGEEELKNQLVTIKSKKTRKEKAVKFEKIIDFFVNNKE